MMSASQMDVPPKLITRPAGRLAAALQNALESLAAVDLSVAYGVPVDDSDDSVAEISVTTWYRPMTEPLRAAGVPESGTTAAVWCLDDASGSYRRPSADR